MIEGQERWPSEVAPDAFSWLADGGRQPRSSLGAGTL
jgi:hypothetical protein